MKRTLALLLTLAMLLTMVGTVAVAAESTFPEATVTVAKDGTVTVKLSTGVKDFTSGHAYVYRKDGGPGSVYVGLTYDSQANAFVGKSESAAEGTISSFYLSNADDFVQFSYSNDRTGTLNSATVKTSTETKGSKERTVTDNTETRSYKKSGSIDSKTLTETVSVYDSDDNLKSKKQTSKTYNDKDVQTGSGEGTTTTTYDKAKDIETEKYVNVTKQYSNEGYLKRETKEENVQEVKKSEGQTLSDKQERKTTNRDGKTLSTYSYKGNYKEGKYLGYDETTKNYNTFTEALISQFDNSYKVNDDEWTNSTTNIYNNDDGSLRQKIVSEYGYKDKEYSSSNTYYNSNNKVEAVYTSKDGNWKDGSGNIIGLKNEAKDDGSKQYTDEVEFKERTGELYSYSTYKKTVKDGTTTETRSSYTEGKLSSENKTITKDGSVEKYRDGVLRYSKKADDKGTIEKTYDVKGQLVQTAKEADSKKTVYNDQDKKVYEADYTEGTSTYYDANTGKMTSFEKSIDNGREYYGADSKLIYSIKWEDNSTVYYDAKGKEFARDIWEKTDPKTEETTYQRVKVLNPWDATATMEKSVSKETYDDNSATETTNYTKWDSDHGTKKNEVTRKEETVWTYGDDKDEMKSYKDGDLVEHQVTTKNDYDDEVKTTTTYYDWFTGKQTGKEKSIESGIEDDPVSYYKRYDRYDNLQDYKETDNTDEWNWSHTYFAGGGLKAESWDGRLNFDNDSYSASYYLDGSLATERWTEGNTSRYVSYNNDGSYYRWRDTENGVANEWDYTRDGVLDHYKWNQQSSYYDENYAQVNTDSYEIYDASGALTYTYEHRTIDDWNNGVYTEVTTRTDPAGNKHEIRNDNGDSTVTLTLANKGSGWQYAVGEWFYVVDGKPVQAEWKQIDGSWYFFNWDGTMGTGLVPVYNTTDGKETSKTYALDGITGAMTTGGWAMLDDYGYNWAFTDANGEVVTGWQQIGGQWYYFDDGWDDGHDAEYKAEAKWTQNGWRGTMATGAVQIWNSDWTSKHTYFFNEDGTWDNSPGWKVAGNSGSEYSNIEYHYYDNAGREVTGWRVIDGDWYYFNEDGVMKNGWVKSGPNWYFMDPAKGGAMATDGWAEDVYEGWYYMDKNGNYKTGWLQDGNTWYYFKDDGAMAAKEWAKSGSDWYYMDENGAMATGWIQDHGNWYCLKSDGTMKTGWEGSGNTWYYLNEDGTMAADTDVTIDGKTYHFDETGLCTNP